MNTSRILLLVSFASLLSACGGGGGGSSSNGLQTPSNLNPSEPPELVFEFAPEPMHPKAFNLAASSGEEENHFSPGDTVSLIWNLDIYYTDNTTIGAGEQYLYDAKVYLSTDDQVQEEDLKLFTIECSLPGTTQHACADTATYQCIYAQDNQSTLSCTSIPLNKLHGFTDLSVDTSSWLDVIPKAANVIFQACLRDEPETCTEAVYPIQLN